MLLCMAEILLVTRFTIFPISSLWISLLSGVQTEEYSRPPQCCFNNIKYCLWKIEADFFFCMSAFSFLTILKMKIVKKKKKKSMENCVVGIFIFIFIFLEGRGVLFHFLVEPIKCRSTWLIGYVQEDKLR